MVFTKLITSKNRETENYYMEVVYRSDQPADDPNKLHAQIEEDLKKSYKIALKYFIN